MGTQRYEIHNGRLPKGNGACLVQDNRIKPGGEFQGLTVFEKHTLFGAQACPRHDGSGGGQPQCARAGNHQDGNQADHGRDKVSPDDPPEEKGQKGDPHHPRDKHRGHPISQCLDGCLTALGLLNQPDDTGKGGVFSHPGGLQHETSLAINGPTCKPGPRNLVYGDGLTRKHGFIHRRLPVQYNPVYRDAFPGPHDDRGPHRHTGYGYLPLLSIFQDGSGFGPKPHQFAYGPTCSGLCPGLQHLAQLDQSDNESRGLKIHMASQQGVKEHKEGIKIGHRRTHGHKDIHIGAAVPEALPAPRVIVPPRVELNRCCQGKEKPVDPRGVAPRSKQPEIPPHAEEEKGCSKNNTHQKLAGLTPYLLPSSL